MPPNNKCSIGENPLKLLYGLGQSPWLDSIRRDDLESGKFAGLQERLGIRGVTTNPTIFSKALRASKAYDSAIEILASRGLSAERIYERLIVTDVRRTADLLRPVYDASEGQDGFVSLEVSPHLALETDATIREATRLWRSTGRPNLMIKVPATLAGLPAISHLIGEGINVNATLLFSIDRYRAVTEAYLEGLEKTVANHRSPRTIASVASFFLSRIDTIVDDRLAELAEEDERLRTASDRLTGQIATASAKCAYAVFEEALNSARFRALKKQGARPQRLLWASTGTKNPDYSDTKYVEPLIGPHTVNTMPLATMLAYADHGQPAVRIGSGLREAREQLAELRSLNISLPELTDNLEAEGIQKFVRSYDELINSIATRRQEKGLAANASAGMKEWTRTHGA